MKTAITDCGQDGCGKCDVRRYLNHLEWAAAVTPKSCSDMTFVVDRDELIERHPDQKYPGWRS